MADRLRDLDDWNQKLRVENLEIRSGARLEVYERQITHLEYQLDLLKRQIGGELDLEALREETPEPVREAHNLLVYGPQGRILRLDLAVHPMEDGSLICQLEGLESLTGEPPRLLITTVTEELMLIFSSGRIYTCPVHALPLVDPTTNIDWLEAGVIEEPNLGETLACIVPISKMALDDFHLQVSRRGYLKKIRKALVPTIMESKYVGTGVKLPADQTLTLMMGYENERYVLVSYEGYLQVVPEMMLPYAIVEAMRLGKTDHLVAAFPLPAGQGILTMTQIGKVIHRSEESLESAKDLHRKGSMLYTTARRSAGVRVIGAAVAAPDDWGVALHVGGQLTLHAISDVLGKGAVPVETELLDFDTFTPSEN
jgi:DNA gyrase/topoisomerase IV subunit A